MADKSLESDGVAVQSTEQMSLFDEEILNSKDPNNAYFKYLVSTEQLDIDDTLTGDSALDSKKKEYQAPVEVQKRWMRMAPNNADAVESDADTLENGSLPRCGGLPNIPESVFGNIKIDKDFKDVTLPPVVYLGKEVDPAEQAPEQAPLPSSHDTSKTHFARNKRAMIAVLIFFFLTTFGLSVALIAFFQRDDDNVDSSGPTTGVASGADGESGISDDNLVKDGQFDPPTTSPIEKVEDADTTAAPTIATTSEPTTSPTISATTVPPTEAPTVAPTTMPPTIPPTKSPTEAPTPAPTDALPFVLEELIALLSPVSPDGGTALTNRNTPQFFAAQWLSNESGYIWYSDQTKIQRYVLATLYLSTSGYQWINSAGWLTERDECEWFSAIDNDDACNLNGEFDRIYLPANNLRGKLPPELALLSNSLERIYLAGNDLTGSVPKELFLLTNLDSISMKQNPNLAGSFPTEIGRMTALMLLDFGETNLSGSLPSEMGQLTSLETLWLDMNLLEGTVPTQIGLATNLEFVTLNSNQLVGSVPSELLRLPHLGILSLDQNNFTGAISVENYKCGELDLSADCNEVQCPCCTLCCTDGIGCS